MIICKSKLILLERDDVRKAREHWQQHHDPAKALELFPKYCIAEKSILTAYQKLNINDHFAALQGVTFQFKPHLFY